MRCSFSMRFARSLTCALTLAAANQTAITSKIGAMDSFFIITNLGLLITQNLRPHRRRESLTYSNTVGKPGRVGEWARGRKRVEEERARLACQRSSLLPLAHSPFLSVITRHGKHALKGAARAFHHVRLDGDFELVFDER